MGFGARRHCIYYNLPAILAWEEAVLKGQATRSVGRHIPGFASPAGLHGEACFVSQWVSTKHLQSETYAKCLNYATVSICATFYPNNNENV